MESEKNKETFARLKKIVGDEKKILRELVNTQEISSPDSEEKKMIAEQEREILKKLYKLNESLTPLISKIIVPKTMERPRPVVRIEKEEIEIKPKRINRFDIGKNEGLDELEKLTLERVRKKLKLNKKEKPKRDESSKPSQYAKISNMFFGGTSSKLAEGESFRSLKRDLVKAKIMHLPRSYISLMLFSTLLSFFISIFLLIFFLFFNISFSFPFLFGVKEALFPRLAKIFWIPLLIPIATFFMIYIYPSLEAKSAESRINFELPFATINMSAISNSMIEPSKIFEIIASTGEYPYLEKEFMRLNNSINVYGYDLVSALRNVAFTSPSKKLSELLNGLATTITSGGDLPKFFSKRAETLLFDYRLEREKSIKSSETFMDIYISVVIAAPMILMLLLMMLKISGLGVGFSVSAITLIMALGVTGINIVFLMFLHLKQPAQ